MIEPPMYHFDEVIEEYKRVNHRPTDEELARLIIRDAYNAKLRPISWEEDVVFVNDIPLLIGPMRRYVHRIRNGYWEVLVIAGL